MTPILGISASSLGRIPDAPTIGTVVGGNATASVPFTAPSNNGGFPITQYVATSSPGGITGLLNQSGSGTITVGGLSNGTAYTFTVTAKNSKGLSPLSSASNSVTPVVPLPVVTGGTLYSDATYYYRKFTSNGTLSVTNASISADVLVVAGGGSGCAGGQRF